MYELKTREESLHSSSLIICYQLIQEAWLAQHQASPLKTNPLRWWNGWQAWLENLHKWVRHSLGAPYKRPSATSQEKRLVNYYINPLSKQSNDSHPDCLLHIGRSWRWTTNWLTAWKGNNKINLSFTLQCRDFIFSFTQVVSHFLTHVIIVFPLGFYTKLRPI